jgi:hypothetical protein
MSFSCCRALHFCYLKRASALKNYAISALIFVFRQCREQRDLGGDRGNLDGGSESLTHGHQGSKRGKRLGKENERGGEG